MKPLFVCILLLFSISKVKAESIVFDSITQSNIKRYEFNQNLIYFPAGLMLIGALTDGNGKDDVKNAIATTRNKHLFGFKNTIDDYAQFLPFIGIYAFEWMGMTPRTDWKNRTAILAKGQILNLGMVHLLKIALNHKRPDGTAYSFPSGHTANVFAGAAMVSIEYGENHKWVPYTAYGIASGVGIMRMVNNKHYISDVLFGAGLGILSMRIAYWTHKYQWNKPKNEKDPFQGSIY